MTKKTENLYPGPEFSRHSTPFNRFLKEVFTEGADLTPNSRTHYVEVDPPPTSTGDEREISTNTYPPIHLVINSI